MQSYLQYRRLRRDAEEDIARAQQAKRLVGSPTDISVPRFNPESETNPVAAEETEKRITNDPEAGVSVDEKASSTSTNTPPLPGVTVSRPDEGDGNIVFLVGWKESDPNNPQEWTYTKKWMLIVTACILCIVLTIPTSVEGPTQEAFNAHFGVNAMAGSMTTGENYLHARTRKKKCGAA